VEVSVLSVPARVSIMLKSEPPASNYVSDLIQFEKSGKALTPSQRAPPCWNLAFFRSLLIAFVTRLDV
jgi:hypothetical protein